MMRIREKSEVEKQELLARVLFQFPLVFGELQKHQRDDPELASVIDKVLKDKQTLCNESWNLTLYSSRR